MRFQSNYMQKLLSISFNIPSILARLPSSHGEILHLDWLAIITLQLMRTFMNFYHFFIISFSLLKGLTLLSCLVSPH